MVQCSAVQCSVVQWHKSQITQNDTHATEWHKRHRMMQITQNYTNATEYHKSHQMTWITHNDTNQTKSCKLHIFTQNIQLGKWHRIIQNHIKHCKWHKITQMIQNHTYDTGSRNIPPNATSYTKSCNLYEIAQTTQHKCKYHHAKHQCKHQAWLEPVKLDSSQNWKLTSPGESWIQLNWIQLN